MSLRGHRATGLVATGYIVLSQSPPRLEVAASAFSLQGRGHLSICPTVMSVVPTGDQRNPMASRRALVISRIRCVNGTAWGVRCSRHRFSVRRTRRSAVDHRTGHERDAEQLAKSRITSEQQQLRRAEKHSPGQSPWPDSTGRGEPNTHARHMVSHKLASPRPGRCHWKASR